VVRVCESLSKLHEYISPSELMLPSSTLTLEEDLKVLNNFDYVILLYVHGSPLPSLLRKITRTLCVVKFEGAVDGEYANAGNDIVSTKA